MKVDMPLDPEANQPSSYRYENYETRSFFFYLKCYNVSVFQVSKRKFGCHLAYRFGMYVVCVSATGVGKMKIIHKIKKLTLIFILYSLEESPCHIYHSVPLYEYRLDPHRS